MKINTLALVIVVLVLLAAFAQPLKECLQELNATHLAKDSLLTLMVSVVVFVLVLRIVAGPSRPRDK